MHITCFVKQKNELNDEGEQLITKLKYQEQILTDEILSRDVLMNSMSTKWSKQEDKWQVVIDLKHLYAGW